MTSVEEVMFSHTSVGLFVSPSVSLIAQKTLVRLRLHLREKTHHGLGKNSFIFGWRYKTKLL